MAFTNAQDKSSHDVMNDPTVRYSCEETREYRPNKHGIMALQICCSFT